MRTEGSPDAATGGRGALPLIGLTMFVFSLVPFIASGAKGVELRSVYVPLIGVGFVIAGAANALRRASGALEPANRRTLAAVGVGLVGATAIAGQLGLIGFQTQFRNNFRLDKRVTAQLATFAPAVQKQTVFMILATDHRGAKTSRDLYNAAIHTALEAPWSANVFLRRAMKRRDVHVIAAPYWSPEDLPITISPSEALRNTGEHIGWERVVPLWIDGSAAVHIVDTLRVRPPEGKPYTIAFPRADSLDQNAGHAAVVFELVPIGPAQTRVDRRTAD
jgi:hypothetical protein